MAAAYKPVYEEHLKKLSKFDEHTKDYGILPKILQRLHDNGRWVLLYLLYFLATNVGASIFTKVDSVGKQHHDLLTSAYDAAIQEFQKHNGDLSNDEDDDSD